jgi:hypothetical protein
LLSTVLGVTPTDRRASRTAGATSAASCSIIGLLTIAAVIGFFDRRKQIISGIGFALTLAGFGALSVAAWPGGAIVYVHGDRAVTERDPPERQHGGLSRWSYQRFTSEPCEV